jgi:hypothetical protein
VSVDAIKEIVENCPNLQYLAVMIAPDDILGSIKQMLKSGFKRLAKIEVNGDSVKLRNLKERCKKNV